MSDKQEVLSSRFKPAERSLMFAFAQLRRDRIEFKGWSFSGRWSETIAISEIVDVEWWSGVAGQPNMRLLMKNGEERVFWLKEAGLWTYEIQKRCGIKTDRIELPKERNEIANAA